MIYHGLATYKITFPCYFQEDSIDKLDDDINDYIDKAINNNPIDIDYGNATIVTTSIYMDVVNATVDVRFDLDCDEYDDEDVFVVENSEIIQEFIQQVEDTLNDLLADHDVFGHLPEDEDVIFDGDSLYVRLAYRQDHVTIDYAATTVSLDGDWEDVASDAYYLT